MKFDVSLIKSPAVAVIWTAVTSLGFAVNVYISSFAWKLNLEFFNGEKIHYSDIRGVYVKSNIAKYLPGNVMHFAGRNALGAKFKFSQFDMALSTVLEVVILIFCACVWSIAFAYKSFVKVIVTVQAKVNHFILAAIIAALILIVAGAVVFIIKKGYLKKIHKLFSITFLKLFLKLFVIYSVTLIVPGIFLAAMFSQILGVTLTANHAVLIVVSYMISWSIGYIVPGAPGGIGVREMALMLILKPICAGEFILVAMIIHRIASIIGDVIAFVYEVVHERRKVNASKERRIKKKG